MTSALLIIDVQKSAVTDKEIAQKIEALQNEYEYVFASQFMNEDSPIIKLTSWKGYEDCDLAFCPAPQTKVFQKTTFSSYLEDLKNFEEVHLCGFDTDACVYQTALTLMDKGIRPLVLKDYCGSATKEFHTYGLLLLERNIGKENIR